MRGRIRRRRRAREEKAPRRGAVIDRATHAVEGLGETLPLIDQDWPVAFDESRQVGLGNGALGGVVEPVDRRRPPQRGGRLADGLRALESYRRQAAEQLVELVIDDAPPIARVGSISRTFVFRARNPSTIPFRKSLQYSYAND